MPGAASGRNVVIRLLTLSVNVAVVV